MSVSMHERIRTDIEKKILSGALAPGDRLPTEHELMAEYSCARMTVNKALSALATAGLLDRRKRAGSFVAAPRLHSMVLDVPDLMQEVLRRGQFYRFQLLKRDLKRSKQNGDGEFDLGPGRMLVVMGLHYADGRELAVEQRSVSLNAVPTIEHASFESEPPGTWLLRHVAWTEAETRISATAADERVASLLHLDIGAPLLQIARRTWRGKDRITSVRQSFRAEAYDLFAKFRAQDITKRSNDNVLVPAESPS
jgi:GntR family transcriptional regulator, histidine utilization repressor